MVMQSGKFHEITHIFHSYLLFVHISRVIQTLHLGLLKKNETALLNIVLIITKKIEINLQKTKD